MALCQEGEVAVWASVKAPLLPLGEVTSVDVEYAGSAHSLIKVTSGN